MDIWIKKYAWDTADSRYDIWSPLPSKVSCLVISSITDKQTNPYLFLLLRAALLWHLQQLSGISKLIFLFQQQFPKKLFSLFSELWSIYLYLFLHQVPSFFSWSYVIKTFPSNSQPDCLALHTHKVHKGRGWTAEPINCEGPPWSLNPNIP